jgi:hypothetical protein
MFATTVTTKPTIVIIPGAWHSPVHYRLLTDALEEAKYSTLVSRLPSVNFDNPRAVSVTTDTEFIRDTMLLPLVNQGKDVLLVMHSYGGIPGSSAAHGISKRERQEKGKPGGVIGLAYIAATLAKEGQSLEDVIGGELDDWIKEVPVLPSR